MERIAIGSRARIASAADGCCRDHAARVIDCYGPDISPIPMPDPPGLPDWFLVEFEEPLPAPAGRPMKYEIFRPCELVPITEGGNRT